MAIATALVADGWVMHHQQPSLLPKIGQSTTRGASALNDRALALQASGDYAKAEPLFKQAIEIDEAALGPDHPQTKQHKANLAVVQSRL